MYDPILIPISTYTLCTLTEAASRRHRLAYSFVCAAKKVYDICRSLCIHKTLTYAWKFVDYGVIWSINWWFRINLSLIIRTCAPWASEYLLPRLQVFDNSKFQKSKTAQQEVYTDILLWRFLRYRLNGLYRHLHIQNRCRVNPA